jgi:hypothetical protein
VSQLFYGAALRKAAMYFRSRHCRSRRVSKGEGVEYYQSLGHSTFVPVPFYPNLKALENLKCGLLIKDYPIKKVF